MLKYRHCEFWCTGYYVDTVVKNTKKIKEYIVNQLSEDKKMEQLIIQEVVDPFKKK
jgi:putative transposase